MALKIDKRFGKISRLAELPMRPFEPGNTPDLECRIVAITENQGKPDDDQKRKEEVPSECRTVPEKLTIPGFKYRPQAFKPHRFS
jgi:hypothetical protein